MSDDHTLRIEGELTIFRAMELKPALLPVPPLTEIDLSGVTEIDTAGVQLLMLAKKDRSGRGARTAPAGPQPGRDRGVRSCSTWRPILATPW
jgi:anti-sigma B factor antagonist